MSILSSFDISGSGMTAQKLRLDIVSQNIANAQVTRTENGEAYRRKMVVLQSSNVQSFSEVLSSELGIQKQGVEVAAVVDDESALVPVYDPTHPDADENGYVMYPNVNTAQEMIDALGASR
ncbi:MAG: flagellar basal body rod protein FlgC, partial [Eubacteriaceae bacterium]